MHIRLKSDESKVFFINPIHFDEKKHEKLTPEEASEIVEAQASEEEDLEEEGTPEEEAPEELKEES